MKDQKHTCSDIRADLPLSVGGDLDATRLECVESHLETCEGCRREADSLSASRRVFQELGAADKAPTPDLWPAVRSGLRAAGLTGDRSEQQEHAPAGRLRSGETPSMGGAPTPSQNSPPLGGSSAAAVVALVAAAALWPPGSGAAEADGGPLNTERFLAEERAPQAPSERGLKLLDPSERGLLEDAVPYESGLGRLSSNSSALAGAQHLTPLGSAAPVEPLMGAEGLLLEEPPATGTQGPGAQGPGAQLVDPQAEPGLGGHIHLRRVR
ncbi:MAG: zf-HC2 domain-containing protein [Planctomycetota bacterium]|nr:zf-HC2 domain-containing protein [Planctomycetota bacterium]